LHPQDDRESESRGSSWIAVTEEYENLEVKYCYSIADQESPYSSIFKREDPSALQPQDDGERLVYENFGAISQYTSISFSERWLSISYLKFSS